ncbi:maltose ABC transporter substrate-binding protein [Cohnella sp. GCM10027633]|uniref:sugar ABC transporter substrate-binding protein n=1 Tax=unclassified Cohnella TaxID=2636738 RepID=UPI00362F350B
MAKKLSYAIILAMLAMSAAACGNSNDSSEGSQPTESAEQTQGATESASASNESAATDEEVKPESGAELKIWVDKTEKTFIEAVLPLYTATYGVPVKIEDVNAPDQLGKLETDGPAGVAGDVLMMPHDKLAQAASANLIMPNDLFEEETRANALETAVQASTYNGILYGYPETIETYALLYNKDLIAEAPKTWEEVIAFAKTYNDPANKKYAIAWLHNLYFNNMFMQPYGGYVFGKDGTDPSDIGINNEGAIEGMKFYQSLYDIVPIKTTDMKFDIQTELFSTGKLAMTIDGPWSVGSYQGKVNLGVAPLPDLPGGKKSISMAGVRSFYVNSYTKYPKAAKLLARFLITKEVQMKDFEMAHIIPANKEANNESKIKDDPIISGFVEQFKNSIPMPSIPQINNMWAPTDAAFASIWDSKKDVKETMDKAVESIKQLNETVGQ